MRNSASIAGIWLRVSRVKNCRHPQKIRLAQQLIAAGELTPSLLKNLSLTSAQVEQFLNYPQAELNRTESWLADQNHHFVTIVDPEYPAQLKSCFGAPLFLFVCGNIHCLNRVQLAVVGSRISSVYGQQWCYEFSSRLSQSGLLITSGLASGIDSIAHQAALDSENATLAVQGCGINYIYPRQHRALYQRIIESDGAVVSEFPPDIPPKAINFPRRNRIISGLSVGTLVIEASLRSGSLITAQHALDQNRNVYALPGPLGKPESEGCHWLIQQGALLVVRPEDLLEDLATGYRSLKFDVSEQINSSQTATVALPFADVLANVGDEVTPVDVVAERAGRSVPEIAAALLELELAGWIAAVPGGYVRLRRACHVRRSYVLV